MATFVSWLFVSVSLASKASILCRGLHSVTAVDKKLYLFGGAPQKGAMLNDLWVLDTAIMQWTELHPEGELPHTRCSHTAVAMGRSIIYFGGSYYRLVAAVTLKSDHGGVQFQASTMYVFMHAMVQCMAMAPPDNKDGWMCLLRMYCALWKQCLYHPCKLAPIGHASNTPHASLRLVKACTSRKIVPSCMHAVSMSDNTQVCNKIMLPWHCDRNLTAPMCLGIVPEQHCCCCCCCAQGRWQWVAATRRRVLL